MDAAAPTVGGGLDGGAHDEVAFDLPVDPSHIEALRRARRRRRVAEVHWVDALYKVYVAGLVGVIAVGLLAGAVGDRALTGPQVGDVTRHGPAVIGLAAALAVAVGLRSGSRGGPLAVEPGDVRHILLAPVDRARALRRPALRQVRAGLFVAVLVGAAVGRLAARRLPEPIPEWIAAGALAALTVAALSLGAALTASGRRLARPVATAIAGFLVAWSVLDVAGVRIGGATVPASPGRAVGWLALAPLDLHGAALAALVAAAGLVALGLAGVGGLSIEAAERRTALVGQLRFAATLQDVRTVLVLRRQLAADQPRDRPWITVSGPTRWPGWRRGLNGMLRFPATRVLRLVLLAAVAGAALRGTWSGTAPLVAVAGLALWIAGLDVVEPLAQEVDHPSRRTLYRDAEGTLLVRLMGPSFVLAGLLGLIAGAVAVAPGPGHVPVLPGLVAGLATAITGAAGAIANVVSGAPSGNDELTLIAPEVAGTKMVLRTAWPPLLAISGAVPLLVVRAAQEAGRPALPGAAVVWGLVAALAALVVAWVHQRQALHQWWADAMEAGANQRRSTTDDADDDVEAADVEANDADEADDDLDDADADGADGDAGEHDVDERATGPADGELGRRVPARPPRKRARR